MQLKHRQNILQSTHNFGSKSNMASSTVARHCHQHDDGYIVNAVCAVPKQASFSRLDADALVHNEREYECL
jgi:hypothetical protein